MSHALQQSLFDSAPDPWELDNADEQLAAADRLNRGKVPLHRACCSRAYYAAYAVVAGEAPIGFPHQHGGNPGHRQLATIVASSRLSPRVGTDGVFLAGYTCVEATSAISTINAAWPGAVIVIGTALLPPE